MADVTAERLFKEIVERKGSDLHLVVGTPPALRCHGILAPLKGYACLDEATLDGVIRHMVGEDDYRGLVNCGDLDKAISLQGGYRLRINAYRQQGTLAMALRLLPNEFLPFEKIGLPTKILSAISELDSGLVLVTGATSSGKSTTIASVVNRINEVRPCHILTIEDPIEYRHRSKRAFVSQREIGRDTPSFGEALRRAMREDPDVVVVGEMRDLETMAAALTLAETGHLTFATLHTSSAVQTISRIINAFPAEQQAQVRVQIASTLQYVICQKLIPWDEGAGRSLAAEVLVVTPAVRAMIREEKSHQIQTAMQTNCNLGMQTLNQSLRVLVKQRCISVKTAIGYSENKKEFCVRG